MKVHVLAFASAGDALGRNELDVEVPPGSDLGLLLGLLETGYPQLGPLWSRLAVAVDGRLADRAQPLREGCEVALLPPVSGGTPEPATATAAVELVDGPLLPAAIQARVSGPTRGAVLLFVGTVRDSHGGEAIAKLTYAAYRPMALAALTRIVGELEAETTDLRVGISHRLGEVPVGEASVVIAVASPHRAAAYAASRRALERLKAEVPIWKREHFASGRATWREEEPLAQR
jgi:molybdopterin synthase catalytic subunit/molybdopterin converting factor small subunit